MPKVGDKRYINTRTNAVMTRPLGIAGMSQIQTWDGKQWVNGENITPQAEKQNRGTAGGNVSLVTPSWMSIANQQPKTPEEQPKETPKKKSNKRWIDPTKTVPTYVAPDGSVHEGMTQDQFNQRMQDYQMENNAYKNQQDNQLQDLYTRALDKYMKEPDSFTEAQKQALVNTAEKLGHLDSLLPSIVTGENMTNITNSTSNAPTSTQAPATTVQPTVTPNNNDVSNYGGRYGAGDSGDYTNRTQGANNAASFWL